MCVCVFFFPVDFFLLFFLGKTSRENPPPNQDPNPRRISEELLFFFPVDFFLLFFLGKTSRENLPPNKDPNPRRISEELFDHNPLRENATLSVCRTSQRCRPVAEVLARPLYRNVSGIFIV